MDAARQEARLILDRGEGVALTRRCAGIVLDGRAPYDR
jgi:hypothetical protein